MTAGTLLTVDEAAVMLRIGRNHCYDLINEGRLPHLRLGRTIRVPRRALDDWIAEEVYRDGATKDDNHGSGMHRH